MFASEEFTSLVTPFISALVALVFTLWMKDLAEKFAKGLMFKMNGAFHQGDRVILDGENSIIVSIGVKQTIFAIQKEDQMVWRYVPNERIPWLNLEKIIR